MQAWVIQENDFNGNVKLNSQSRRSFYRYSLWRARTGEHLFDGAAGDLAEALDTMRAHIRYLSAGKGLARGEKFTSYETITSSASSHGHEEGCY